MSKLGYYAGGAVHSSRLPPVVPPSPWPSSLSSLPLPLPYAETLKSSMDETTVRIASPSSSPNWTRLLGGLRFGKKKRRDNADAAAEDTVDGSTSDDASSSSAAKLSAAFTVRTEAEAEADEGEREEENSIVTAVESATESGFADGPSPSSVEAVAVASFPSASSPSGSSSLHATICATALEASAAYRDGRLRSDFDVSSNHRSIRVAFRYVVEEEAAEGEEEEWGNDEGGEEGEEKQGSAEKEKNEDAVVLCWVGPNGEPHHFYSLHPRKVFVQEKEEEEEKVEITGKEEKRDTDAADDDVIVDREKNGGDGCEADWTSKAQAIREGKESYAASFTSSSSSSSRSFPPSLLVTEHDHVENTKPGHAFVFCRRVPYRAENSGGDDDEGKEVVVRNEEGMTIFLRKVSKGGTAAEEDGGSAKAEGPRWEAFAVVGGYRPGVHAPPPPPSSPPKRKEVEDGGEEDEEKQKNGEEWTEIGDGDGKEDDDDENEDVGEFVVQLVTIVCPRRKRNRPGPKTKTKDREEVIVDNNDDDDPSPALFDCASCLVPFLPGGLWRKPRHEPAFVSATEEETEDGKEEKRRTEGKEGRPVPPPLRAMKVAVHTTRLDPTPFDTSSKHYEKVVLGGWPCKIEPGCFPDDGGGGGEEDDARRIDDETAKGGDEDENDEDPEVAASAAAEAAAETDERRGTAEEALSVPPDRSSGSVAPAHGDGRPPLPSSSLRARFESDLAAARRALPMSACRKLESTTPVWINRSQSFGPKASPVRGRDACFHPGSKWLVRNGMTSAKRGGVEFFDAAHYLSDCDLWGPGGLILHELSHAYHCLHVKDGYDNTRVKECYDKAMEEGLYNRVQVHGCQGPECRAYACQDPMEFFAELSVAFLGGDDPEKEHNKWYPFNRTQLRKHDPRSFDMLCEIWNVDENMREVDSTKKKRRVIGWLKSRK